ncbi:MAG: hypothetical protein HKO53_01095 [Gemmatimonadetes bacterium]|nr:hypothetical protein [Gemmatimonadota bacterium]NNM31628.1 hypothetical protein [Gemmatimonadota bacterium]
MTSSSTWRLRLWAIGLLIAAFGSGVLVGSQWSRPDSGSLALPPFLYRSVLDSLQLTPTQAAAVEAVVERHGRAVDSTMRAAGLSLAQDTESTHLEIEGLLDPERRAAFRQAVADLQERLGSGMRVRGPGPSTPPAQPRE